MTSSPSVLARHFVVTGSGKCGTHFFQAVLAELGVAAAHEGVLAYEPVGTPDWGPYRGDCSWPAAMHLHALEPGTPVLHLVRDPLAVLNARFGENKLSDTFPYPLFRTFVRAHLPHVFDEAVDDLGRNLLFVEGWNRHLDRTPELHADLAYRRERVEDLSSEDPALLDDVVALLTGARPGAAACRTALARVGAQTGRGGDHAALTWADVRAHPNGAGLLRLAADYGYDAA
ncbi:MAG: hypothetical protein JO265_14620 [Acidimicrobiia bacterium]|nr:hypothetical protein [Acidimicrobiia bacterium]